MVNVWRRRCGPDDCSKHAKIGAATSNEAACRQQHVADDMAGGSRRHLNLNPSNHTHSVVGRPRSWLSCPHSTFRSNRREQKPGDFGAVKILSDMSVSISDELQCVYEGDAHPIKGACRFVRNLSRSTGKAARSRGEHHHGSQGWSDGKVETSLPIS